MTGRRFLDFATGLLTDWFFCVSTPRHDDLLNNVDAHHYVALDELAYQLSTVSFRTAQPIWRVVLVKLASWHIVNVIVFFRRVLLISKSSSRNLMI